MLRMLGAASAAAIFFAVSTFPAHASNLVVNLIAHAIGEGVANGLMESQNNIVATAPVDDYSSSPDWYERWAPRHRHLGKSAIYNLPCYAPGGGDANYVSCQTEAMAESPGDPEIMDIEAVPVSPSQAQPAASRHARKRHAFSHARHHA